MSSLKNNSFKLAAAAGVVVLAGIMAPTANAALVTGNATITIDNTAFSAASVNVLGGYPNGWVVAKHWGPSDNLLGISGSTVGGTTLSTTGSTAMDFSVNTNTTTNSYPTAGTYGRTEQATTMDASNTSVGQIGLSGAWLLTSAGGSGILAPYDFSLVKTAGIWNIRSFDNGFSTQNFLKLTDVTESVNSNGELLLSGNLKWTGLWAGLTGANTNAVVGTFNLAPAAVPVPAAVWMFVSGMFGLLGIARRKSTLAA
ncbi:MAG: hypothetical protein Q8N35_02430 [Methylococcaceae bacterium]|nr:hypothetical protein [Methylococcaceae bacterium]MDZ4156837.1 hypothetical protein [Methylococcales bacterium]MDP2391747.1 hypothetical protein [Methylococcaceae bacterium]MDP3018421.1 hypothetical protein [Methylococcaceae bacterium]MDP3389463.1 hypothetical protein [Methylococcaceae bacterium]